MCQNLSSEDPKSKKKISALPLLKGKSDERRVKSEEGRVMMDEGRVMMDEGRVMMDEGRGKC